jgi:hypothetical protein
MELNESNLDSFVNVIPVNAPEMHLPCLRARWQFVCDKYNSLDQLELDNGNEQALRNLMEIADLMIKNVSTLEYVRSTHPNHHDPSSGISEDGQLEIYFATIEFHNSVYMVLSNLSNVVSKNLSAFKTPATSSVTKFLQWLAAHDIHKFGVNQCIRPSKAFRTIVNHPQHRYSYNWETCTNGKSGVYVMLKGLGSTDPDTPTDSSNYAEGAGWHLPSPEECLTTIFILDLISWVLDGVRHACASEGAFSDENWYRLRNRVFNAYLRENVDAVTFEFRRAVPTTFDNKLFDGISVFD